MKEEKLYTIFNEVIVKQPINIRLGGYWCKLIRITGRVLDDSHEILCENGDGWQITSTISKIESLRF